jgi:hypothetical protein
MNSEAIAEAEGVLREFWLAMHQWETNACPHADKIGTPQIEPIARELQVIYERFLVPKERKLGRLFFAEGKPRCASIGFPPEYDPQRETITGHEVKNETKIIIDTEMANHLNPGLKTPQRYQLVRSADGFRIDKKERFSALKKKWVLLHL